jgi:predicted dehydrogenase
VIATVATPDAVLTDDTIGLVVIATPSATHMPLAKAALLAGKHIVVDKPVGLSLAEVRQLAEMSRNTGRHLFAFHNRRWDSDFLSVRSAIKSGLIGRVTHFESHFDRFRPNVQSRWREDRAPGSGVWLDLGPHLVDQALLLFGRPVAVTADIAALRAGSKSDDWAHVVLRYDGLRVVLHASLNSPDGSSGGCPRFSIFGTQGTLTKQKLDPQEGQLAAGIRPGDSQWGLDPDPLLFFDATSAKSMIESARGCQNRFYEMVEQCLTAEAPSNRLMPNTLDEIVAVHEVIDAARLSADKGNTVYLPLPE